MLEIIALILLSRENGKLAQQKGLNFWPWVWYTVASWIGFEFVGAFIGLLAIGQENILMIYLLALASAVGGYFLIRSLLKKKPDIMDDDINRIGVRDLYP